MQIGEINRRCNAGDQVHVNPSVRVPCLPPSLSFLMPGTVTGGRGCPDTESVHLDKFNFCFLRNNADVRFYGPN